MSTLKLLCLLFITPLLAIEPEKEITIELCKTFSLRVNQEEGAAINEIITTLEKNSLIALGFKQSHLKALGKRLHGVGSLQFLAYIFSHQHLKECMQAIRKSSFKWNSFVGGLKPSLDKELATKQLPKELPGFASFLHADYETLKEQMEAANWDGFITALLKS